MNCLPPKLYLRPESFFSFNCCICSLSEENMRQNDGRKNGNAEIVEVVLREHGCKWFRFALKVLGDPFDAEDVLQEGVRRVLGARKPFETNDELRLYLARVICNTAFELYRSKKKLRELQAPISPSLGFPGYGGDPVSLLFEKEGRREQEAQLCLLREALDGLPTKEYEALRAIDLDPGGNSIREASALIGIPYSTLRHRRKSGLRRLRRFFNRVIRKRKMASTSTKEPGQ
jgi:RNA polymerase sigma factor (sigma-70 family)